jgi:hypothetical protein
MMPSRFNWRDAVYLGCFILDVPLGVAFAVRDEFGALVVCLLALLLVMLLTTAVPQRATE